MRIKDFITNPYMDGIYQSFRGIHSDDGYHDMIDGAVKQALGARELEILKVECGVGLSVQMKVDRGPLVQVKIIKGIDSLQHQTECCNIQRYLRRHDFPCTNPIADPLALAGCSMQIEEHDSHGEYRDSHDDSVMRLQASQLALLTSLLASYRSDAISHIAPKVIPRDKVWNNPPQAVFSFDQHQSGDEAIKRQARAAKAIFEEANQRQTILSHEDWSNKHFRFTGQKVSVIYDWDSITRIDELHNLGLACSTFTATWYFPTRIFPSPAESKKFVEAFALASGRTFSKDELRIISAYAAYTIAYIARCVFALNGGAIAGNDIEAPFNEIKSGLYF